MFNDKGYLDSGWWHAFDEAGAFFVSRLKTNSKRRAVRAATGPLEPGIIADNTLQIGHRAPRARSRGWAEMNSRCSIF